MVCNCRKCKRSGKMPVPQSFLPPFVARVPAVQPVVQPVLEEIKSQAAEVPSGDSAIASYTSSMLNSYVSPRSGLTTQETLEATVAQPISPEDRSDLAGSVTKCPCVGVTKCACTTKCCVGCSSKHHKASSVSSFSSRGSQRKIVNVPAKTLNVPSLPFAGDYARRLDASEQVAKKNISQTQKVPKQELTGAAESNCGTTVIVQGLKQSNQNFKESNFLKQDYKSIGIQGQKDAGDNQGHIKPSLTNHAIGAISQTNQTIGDKFGQKNSPVQRQNISMTSPGQTFGHIRNDIADEGQTNQRACDTTNEHCHGDFFRDPSNWDNGNQTHQRTDNLSPMSQRNENGSFASQHSYVSHHQRKRRGEGGSCNIPSKRAKMDPQRAKMEGLHPGPSQVPCQGFKSPMAGPYKHVIPQASLIDHALVEATRLPHEGNVTEGDDGRGRRKDKKGRAKKDRRRRDGWDDDDDAFCVIM